MKRRENSHWRRTGRFRLSIDDIDASPDLVRLLLCGLIVIRAKMLYESREIEYLALGEVFDETPPMTTAPWYDVQTERDEQGRAVTHMSFVPRRE